MGKGRIVSGGTDGSYTVELLHNRTRINAELDFLAAKLTELQTELDALETERDGLVAERNAIATEIDEAVANAEEGEIPDVEALLFDLAQVSAQIQAQDVRIALIHGRMLEARKRQQMLQAIPADPQQQAWCADFTENLTGDVATVEVPAEGVVGQFATWRRVIVRPGYEGRATYSPARDGQMFHREGQVGYQAYLNAAILPGVQRWRPQYRIGTITAIDAGADTCSLTIQGEDSSAQALIIDPPDLQYAKTGVPIEYMDCNARAFEVGDRVLIEFQGRDWSQPKVIGFESNPRECEDLIATWIMYRSQAPFEYVVQEEPVDPPPDGCPTGGVGSWNGQASGYASTELIITRNAGMLEVPDEEWEPENLVEAFRVADLTESDWSVAGFVYQYRVWITAQLSGTQVGTFEGAPIHGALTVTSHSPTVVSRGGVPTGLSIVLGACTDGSDYRVVWQSEFSAASNPTIQGSLDDFEVVGWIDTEYLEAVPLFQEGTNPDPRFFTALTVLRKIEPE